MKKIFLVFFILVIFASAGIIYLNKVILPLKIKSLLITGLEQQIHLPVKLESLELNIFKGIVLRNLSIGGIGEDAMPILSLKECSCTFLIFPFFKKQIIIPEIQIKSAVVFLERRADNTLNISDFLKLLNKTDVSVPQKALPVENSKFKIFIYKVTILDSRIDFEDYSLSPKFAKSIGNLNLRLNLSLPANIMFNLKSEIQAVPPINVIIEGVYHMPQEQLSCKIGLKNFSPQEFLPYWQKFGITNFNAAIDMDAQINLKNNIVSGDLNTHAQNLHLLKDNFSFKLNQSDIKASLQYSLKNKQLDYSGKADILNLDILGLELVERIENLQGEVKFDNSGLSSGRLNADIFGLPVQAKLKLTDFIHPLLDINLTTRPSLEVILAILKDKFKVVLPVKIKGESYLSLNLQSKLTSIQPPAIDGYLDVLDAAVKVKDLDTSFESVNGKLEFTQNQINWQDLNFKYSGIAYKTKGALFDFNAPVIELELSSQDALLHSKFRIIDKTIDFQGINGRYFNSDFLLSGSIDSTNPLQLRTNINGQLDIELSRVKDYLKKFKKQLDVIKPTGRVQVKFHLDGNIKDIKSCILTAKIDSRDLSLYGLKPEEFSLEYNQADKLIDIPLSHLFLYDGIVNLSAKINLSADSFPLWINADIKDVKLEKLKLDTPAKKEDISGTIQAGIKLNGYASDISKLNGTGEILISEGKLWRLNLLKGLGQLLFTQDFTNIVFSQGYCGFSISDKLISSDNLELKSNLMNISGHMKIGFDSSVEALLNVEVLDNISLTGTFKDITSAILGQAGKFGVIKISGTLHQPKYSFRPAVVDIIKVLTDTFLKK